MRKSFDVLLLFILVMARIRIDTLADLVLPNRHADVRRLVEGWWPVSSFNLLEEWLSDPVTLMLISTAITLLIGYVLVDLLTDFLSQQTSYRLKLGLIYSIVVVLVFGKAFLLIGLRHITEPSAYTHDGGVIQTEVTIDYFLSGKSPYIENYLDTAMATWGIEFRTALHHYPYLPWTFVFPTPFYLLSQATLGWYDQRFIYLVLFGLTLILAQSLAPTRSDKLMIVMLMGLNPILASDVIFGQNDSFILFWILLGVWFLRLRDNALLGTQADSLHPPASSNLADGSSSSIQQTPKATRYLILANLAYGLACASKPTAWFLAPFWALYLLKDNWGDQFIPPPSQWLTLFKLLMQRVWPIFIVMLVVVGPWALWSPDALIDDVWRWSSGTADVPYQIRGWGLSNFVLAFQLVPDRLAFWPFWATEILLATPILLLTLWRQRRSNNLGQMLYGHVSLLFVFFYSSRFLNENYLGYLAGFLILAVLIDDEGTE
ncbi:hypothetical protein QUF64_05970 [Anaerolineales bacterium HSG6]|nr:hypothetical protein [Anaerolineales bacterium HSG6]MDM8530474.1 hypothetical protein [Anaerolineales bacterium HSG25]